MLQKILEATHLLYVRACTKDDCFLHNKTGTAPQGDIAICNQS
ncbi:hypothetical protein [Parafilimonas sp.]